MRFINPCTCIVPTVYDMSVIMNSANMSDARCRFPQLSINGFQCVLLQPCLDTKQTACTWFITGDSLIQCQSSQGDVSHVSTKSFDRWHEEATFYLSVLFCIFWLWMNIFFNLLRRKSSSIKKDIHAHTFQCNVAADVVETLFSAEHGHLNVNSKCFFLVSVFMCIWIICASQLVGTAVASTKDQASTKIHKKWLCELRRAWLFISVSSKHQRTWGETISYYTQMVRVR